MQIAHESLGGESQTHGRFRKFDRFRRGRCDPARGAARVGADVSPRSQTVALLLSKVVLEYIPKHGKRLAEEVSRWATWVRDEAAKELNHTRRIDGAVPIAYLWAGRFIAGPGCGAEVRSCGRFWLAKKSALSITFHVSSSRRNAWTSRSSNGAKSAAGHGRRGSATCPVCGYTILRVRAQLAERREGAHDARMTCVVTTRGPPSRAGATAPDSTRSRRRQSCCGGTRAAVKAHQGDLAHTGRTDSSRRPSPNARGLSAVTT